MTYGGYYEAFRETLSEKEQDKIDYCLLLLKVSTFYRIVNAMGMSVELS